MGIDINTHLDSLRTRLTPHILNGAGPAVKSRTDGEGLRATGDNVLMNRSWRWLKHWLWTLGDAFPPYRNVDGQLEFKNATTRKYYIRVGGIQVEVDRATFETLAVGDTLKVRYTRGNRAVNIDQVVTENGNP
jgi:hypothetical protein